ncbi:ubiquitin carboxyl-terminal hydrolase MINDY-2-like [Glandiceps talaboti]
MGDKDGNVSGANTRDNVTSTTNNEIEPAVSSTILSPKSNSHPPSNESDNGKCLNNDGDQPPDGSMDSGNEEKMDIRGSLRVTDDDDAMLVENQQTNRDTVQQNDKIGTENQQKDIGDTKVQSDNCELGERGEGNRDKSEKAISSDSSQSVYHIKWIKFKGRSTPIVTQNENGPCPLLSIVNVLILKGQVVLPDMVEMITSGQLMEYLGDYMLAQTPKNISEGAQLNYEQNMHDAMAVFPKLQTGLDVNVKFTGVADFEYTSELTVFDLLNIGLIHGWLVDPQNEEHVKVINNCSYNQLVEKIISCKSAKEPSSIHEGLVAEAFLESSAAQLTYHGLCELNVTVKEDQLCVFFRNNHFSTLYKHKNELFLLVTDQGFLTENNVVWETLANTEGDSYFVDGDFHTRPPCDTTPPIKDISTEQQINQDYLVALTLQEEQVDGRDAAPPSVEPQPPIEAPLSDHELAMRLQEEENLRAAQARQGAVQQQQQQQDQVHQQQQQPPPQHQQHQQNRQRRQQVQHSQPQQQEEKTCTLL